MRKLIPFFIILLAACAVWAAGVPYTGSVDVSDVENLNSATITYDNSTSGMTADDVKDALDELDAAIASVSTAGLNLAGISVTAETTGIDAKYMLMEDSGGAQKMTMENLADWIVLIAQPLDAQLTDLADGTIAGDFVNTANPWADNEVSDTITVGASGSVNDAAIPSGITRDTEWNTIDKIETATSVNVIVSTEIDSAAELNALTADTDMVLDTDIGSTVQAYHASLAAIAGGTWTGANSITTLGTIATGVWNGTKVDADYINVLAADTTLTDRDDTDYILLHDSSGVTSAKMTVGNFVSGLGGTGSSITLDLADDGNNESTGVTEIATTGTDTNSIFTEPSANKLLINLGADWPKADVADVASTGDSATSFFSTGTLEIGVGGTGSALTDPNADRVMFWDDSEGAVAFLTMDTNHFSYSATTLSIGADTIDATLIDWGSGANQVDLDDVPDSATYQKVAAGSVNASAAVDLLTDSDATGAITVTGLSTTRAITFADADQTVMSSTAAQNVSGDKEIQDNVALSFGNDNDWEVTYDETTSDALEFTHTAGAGADVTFDLNDNAAASTFNIINSDGTYAANLAVDGNATVTGTLTVGSGSGDSYLSLNNNAALAASGDRLYFVGNELTVSENGEADLVLTDGDSATLTGTSWDFSAVTNFEIPNAAAPTTDAFGEIAADNNAWATGRGALQVFDGTANTWVVAALTTDTPENGQVPKWNTGGTITWEDDNSAGSPTINSIGDASAAADIDFDISETMTWNFTGNFTTGSQFLIEQKTGDPSGGTLFEVKGADANPVLASFGDGTNKINISNTGGMTLGGTALITAGGLILGDSTPDASGEIGYASNAYNLYANSEDMVWTAGTNTWTYSSNTGANLVLGTPTATSLTVGALEGVNSIDATGAVDMDYGSADVTDHTFTSDGGTVILDGSGAFSGAVTAASFAPTRVDAAQYVQLFEATGQGDSYFTITTPALAGNVAWTLPNAAAGGANYLINVDADGTMGYTDPSTIGGGTATDFALSADADAGDYDITSIDKLEGYDAGVFIDMGADGIVQIASDNDIHLDLEDETLILGDGGANIIAVTSDTGVNVLDFGGIALYTTAGLSGKVPIEEKSSTSNITAEPYCYGGIVTNTGASGAVVLTLPDAVKGMSLKVILTVAQDVDINPQNGEQILVKTNATGDALSSDATIGSACTLIAVSDTQWMATTEGTWTDVN